MMMHFLLRERKRKRKASLDHGEGSGQGEKSSVEDGPLTLPIADWKASTSKRKRSGGWRSVKHERGWSAISSVLVVTLLFIWTLGKTLALSTLPLMIQFKIRNWAWDEPDSLYRTCILGMLRANAGGCPMRKEPILTIHGDDRLQMIFEMTCNRAGVGVSWTPVSPESALERTKYNLVPTVVPNEERPFDRRNWLYRVDLDQLQYGTRYRYTIFQTRDILFPLEHDVQDRTARSILRDHQFTWSGATSQDVTAATRPVHFAVLGDNQSGIKQFIAVNRALSRLPSKYRQWYASANVFPSLLLHVGDAVQLFESMQQWQTDFLDPLQQPYRHWGSLVFPVPSPVQLVHWALGRRARRPAGLTASSPALFAHGNHDRDLQGENVYTTGRGRNQPSPFGQLDNAEGPLPGVEAGGWEAVTIRAGLRTTARLIVLDSNIDFGESDQVAWFLRETRQAKWQEATFRIIMVHIPPFVEFWDRESWAESGRKEHAWTEEMRRRWVPLFDEAKVDLVISGHQHAYSRGFLPHDRALRDAMLGAETGRWTGKEGDWNSSSIAHSLEQGRKGLATRHDGAGPVYDLGHGEYLGAMYTIVGGAGGELDYDRVEDWHFYDKSVTGLHHFVVMTMTEDEELSRLVWRAFDTRARVLDSFEMVKSVH